MYRLCIVGGETLTTTFVSTDAHAVSNVLSDGGRCKAILPTQRELDQLP